MTATRLDGITDEPTENPLSRTCSLCGIRFSTGACGHLLNLDDGRVVLSRSVWEGLIEDRHRLRALDGTTDEPTEDGCNGNCSWDIVDADCPRHGITDG